MLDIVILAAGKGTRMRSNTPKVLHTLAAKPFVSHVIDRAKDLAADNIHLVVGYGADAVKAALPDSQLNYIDQTEQLGTGHAVLQVLPSLQPDSNVLILYGDVPLINTETLKNLLQKVSESAMGLLTINLEDPTGYGRIVRNPSGQVAAIVEHKDATAEQHAIKEVNTGVMAVKSRDLQKWLPALTNNNAQGEYYLTDIIAMSQSEGIEIKTAQPANEYEVLGVNNRQQQAELERVYQQLQAKALMDDGVTLLDPSRFDCRGSIKAGMDCVIDINCVFEGEVQLGNNVQIGASCSLKNVAVGNNVTILPGSIIEDAVIENDCNIGPFARLRPGTRLATGARIGNFVEIKKANIGKGSKVNHLSYVGDAEVGEGVNIGAGTITCNYDGVNKHKTTIDDGVFVGSNTALVAPVKLGKNSTVAAGSVVTVNAKENQLVVARSRQRNVDGWRPPHKKK